MNHVAHRKTSPATTRCFVLTISDTRTNENDNSGAAIVELLTDDGHEVLGKTILPDEPEQIRTLLDSKLTDPSVQVIITTGGTGISFRDVTYEIITHMLDKRIEGFGELFRALSYKEIGPAAMLSRACAGTAHGKVLISMPGSENAVRLAMTKLILPELGHLVMEASK